MTDEQVLAALSSMQATLKADLHADLKALMSPMTAEISSLKADMSSVKTDMSSMKTEISSVKKDMSSMKTEMSSVKTEMGSMKEDLLGHIHGVGAQLHTQIQEFVERMDHMQGRLDRHGGLLQGGSRSMTRFIEWSESADSTFFRYDGRLRAIEKRLEQIEGGKNGN
jgi:chromosome segregation ATPase